MPLHAPMIPSSSAADPGEAAAGPGDLLALEAALVDEVDTRESLSQRAYNQIRRSLISSAMPPGHRLILRPLAIELGLSPTPVREALLRLVSEHALALDERGSAIVPIMTPRDFHELAEVRGDLEARVAERAVEYATEEEIDSLERINGPCLAAYQSNQHLLMLESNGAFHRAVCRLGRAPLMLRMLEGLWMRIGPLYAISLDQPLPAVPDAEHPHTQLIAALRRRDVGAARDAAKLDVSFSNRVLGPKLPPS